MEEHETVLRIAVAVPLRRLFDYLPSEPGAVPPVGVRVRVPFRGKSQIGVVVATGVQPEVGYQRLRRVSALLDREPLWPTPLFRLLRWAATYYHHPEGEVFATALPGVLGRGARPPEAPRLWRLTTAGQRQDPVQLARAPRQQALLTALQTGALAESELRTLVPNLNQPLKRLEQRGWITTEPGRRFAPPETPPAPGPELNPAQLEATRAIQAAEGFQAFLVEGVTGSGKTEVYFQAMGRVLARGEQVLVLVPEIALTPQLLARFRQRLAHPLAVAHSGLSAGERLAAWEAARTGEVGILLGTRSTVFTPLARPGLIVVDEEHDPSFKQQEGFRYHARDLALARGAREGIPVVLGSATPSLESLYNAEHGRYQRLRLPHRVGDARLPTIEHLDMRGRAAPGGLALELIREIEATTARGEQALLFLNRRGFAPVLLCPSCGWIRQCPACDRPMTFHQSRRMLLCHLCGHSGPIPQQCPETGCGNPELQPIGLGLEQLEATLAEYLPDRKWVRVDRDTTQRQGNLEAKLEAVQSGQVQIALGTQMLVKGHHFPGVTLVAVVAADGGLYSADFRARERLFQQVLQVAGRAGRGDQPGRVWVQTFHPDHPMFTPLRHHDYAGFAAMELTERRVAALPPYCPLALLRCEAPDPQAPFDFLEQARGIGPIEGETTVRFLGPTPAPIERLKGRYRAQLLITAPNRTSLHRTLTPWVPRLEGLKTVHGLRWSLDVDPADLF